MKDRVFETPAGVTLGAAELIADNTARNFVLQIDEPTSTDLWCATLVAIMVTSIGVRTQGFHWRRFSTTT